jgi:hypothetical protein
MTSRKATASMLLEREPGDPMDELDLRVRRLEQGHTDHRGLSTAQDRRLYRTEQLAAWTAGAVDALCRHLGVDLEQPMPTFPEDVDPNAETQPLPKPESNGHEVTDD